MICYWSEHCMLWPSLWFVTGQNTLCYEQVYDLLLVRTLYGMTRFMICYCSEHCMLRPCWWFVTGQNTMVWPSLWFVTGQNTVCYDQVYDLLLGRTLYATTKFMICYRSEQCMLRPSLWFVTGQNTMLRPSLWFVAGQNTVCYDQVYDLLLVWTLYVTTTFMIYYLSEMFWPVTNHKLGRIQYEHTVN
jgi:hypothetical protein